MGISHLVCASQLLLVVIPEDGQTDRQSQLKAPQQLELRRIWSSHYISLIDTFRLPFPGIAPDQVENNNNINT